MRISNGLLGAAIGGAAVAVALGGATVYAQETATPPVVDPALASAPARAERLAERVRTLTKANAALRRQVKLRTADDDGITVYDAAELAHRVVGWPAEGALRVAFCESRYVEHARNKVDLSGSNATGWWQVLYDVSGRRSSTWHSTALGKVFPVAPKVGAVNALVAALVWDRADGVIGNRRGSFKEWNDTCATLAP